MGRSFWTLLIGILLLAAVAYSNHFQNTFQFDDAHTVVNNPWIRDIKNIPLFFRDATTFSVFPPNRVYRPLVSTSLAIDYWLGGGTIPFWFHLSTFLWFLVQICFMAVLFRRALQRHFTKSEQLWTAMAATAIYAVHPAIAETINYVIQRADVYSTLGVVAGLVIFSRKGADRHDYILPVVAALLCKPPAVVFPVLLFLWMLWIEDIPAATAFRRSIPALAVTIAVMAFTKYTTPPSFGGKMISTVPYLTAQPAVILHYFGQFFLPLQLTGDSDFGTFASPLDPLAAAGFAFVIIMLAATVWFARKPGTRPIAFGLAWFLVGCLPTSLYPLAEVENDHRMYFPFVGLTLAVCAAIARLLPALGLPSRWRTIVLAGTATPILVGLAWGTTQRNQVWRTPESFWSDVAQKSPGNAKGLNAYGLVLMLKGDDAGALTMFERAAAIMPEYFRLETNLGTVWDHLGNPDEAERHYLQATKLAPALAEPRIAYAEWLMNKGRLKEAIVQASLAIKQIPDEIVARHTLMTILDKANDAEGLRDAAKETLDRFRT